MNRANGIGPVAPDLVPDPRLESGVIREVGQVGGRLASQLGSEIGHGSMLAERSCCAGRRYRRMDALAMRCDAPSIDVCAAG